MIKINNQWDAYVAVPEENQQQTALLYLPDVMGIWVNSQLMADQFAANGYYCVIPDIFNGDALSLNRPAGFDLKKWISEGSDGKNPHTTTTVDPIVEATIKTVKEELAFTKIAAVGYCFGAKVGSPPNHRVPSIFFQACARWRLELFSLNRCTLGVTIVQANTPSLFSIVCNSPLQDWL
jgi:hypothetical protein